MAIRKPTSDVGAYGAKRWAINPAGHSPRHTNKVLELVSKLVVHSSISSDNTVIDTVVNAPCLTFPLIGAHTGRNGYE